MVHNKEIRQALLDAFARAKRAGVLGEIEQTAVDRSLFDTETPMLYGETVPLRSDLPLEQATRRSIHGRFPP